MASKYEISTIFKMIDNFSGPMKNIAGSSSSFAKKFSADMRKTEMQIQAAGRAMKTMAGVAAGAGVALAGKTVVDSVKTYVEFEDAVTKAGSKFKDLDVTSADYGETLEKLQTAAREVGAVTKFSATDSANALSKMAMAGITSDDAMKMLMGTTNLAAAAGTDLTTAVDIATDALGIYGKDLASKGFAGLDAQLDKISDVMAKTGVLANTDLQGLFEAMTYAGPSFVTAGQSIETFSAAMGTLASAGIKGSSAGTALNAIFTQLGKADKRAKLEGLGVSVQDAQGNFRNLIDIVADLEKSLEGMGNVEKKSLLNSIFDVRGEKAITALMTAGSDAIRNFENELINSQGTAANVANAQMQSFQGMIEQLKSAYQDKQLSLAKAFEVGGAKEALAGLIAYVQNFDITPFANLLTNIMQALPGIIEGLGNVFQLLWNMKDVIGALVIAWGVYKGALIAALVVEKVMGFVTAVQTMMAATQGMTAAQAALNVVMNANPIGLIVTAVAALGLGVYELIKHWDSVSAAMSVAWEWLQKIGSIIWDGLLGAFEKVKNFFIDFQPLLTLLLGPLGILINMIIEFKNNLNGIKEAFTDGGFVAGIRTIGATILSAILAPIQKVLELMVKIPFIGEKAQGGLDTISSIRQNSFGKQPVTLPVTQGERTAYSMSETINEDHVKIDVALEKGLNGTVSGSAPKTSLNLVNSGAW